MNPRIGLEQARSFIGCHLRPASTPTHRRRMAVTLSRLAGAGAWIVARELAARLDQRAPAEDVKWTVFDKELVEHVLENHNLPKKLVSFMPEDRVSMLEDMVTELLGLHPPSWNLVRATSDTILRLAAVGNVILIGRGANVITMKLPHMVHVRLVGSLEKRIERVMEYLKLERKAAVEFVEKADRGHHRYLREHFKVEIDNPLLYDLIINTDRVTCEQAAEFIAEVLLRRAASEEARSGTHTG